MNSAEHFKKTQVSKKKDTLKSVSFFLEATPGFEPGNQGFADPCLTTWLCRRTWGQSVFPSPISICTPAARYSARGPASGGCLQINAAPVDLAIFYASTSPWVLQ